MNSKYDFITMNGFLTHHGITGQKWGIRRFQNPDGSLTEEGKRRYQRDVSNALYEANRKVNKNNTHRYVQAHNNTARDLNATVKDFNEKWRKLAEEKGIDWNNMDVNSEFYQSYIGEWNQSYDKLFTKYYNTALHDEIKYTREMQMVESLIKQYGDEVLTDATMKTMKEYRDLIED